MIALLAVQVGVHPRTRRAGIGLGGRMGAVPVAPRVVPQRLQRKAQTRRHGGPGGRGAFEFRK
jgi:hypothetical protein